MIVPTKLGKFRAEYSSRGVTLLERLRSGGSRSRVATGGSSKQPLFIRKLARQLKQYASGKPVRWSVPVDLSSGTDFQQKVWRALARIPRGQMRSYAWVAQIMGKPKAARAVGAACGANPVPVIIPCHRVIASTGLLGGYSPGGR